MTGDGLVRIRQALPTLRPAEARIAEAVLADPTAVVGSTINELAARAGASQATVVRFCRAIGYAGYPEFRIDLAQATSRREMEMERSNVAHGEINETDTAEDVVAKIAFHEARTIEETARMLDLAALEQVAAAVAAAPRVDVFGVGSSGLTGQDLAQKLQRIGLVCFASPDPHLQLQSAALLGPGAVAIGISHSGQTVETNHALGIAHRRGATSVAITNFPESPLAQEADVVLGTTARETQFRSGALSSRIAQLAVVDFLFVRVAQRLYDQTSANLKATYDAVQPHRLDGERKARA
ncbi:RpiR family transcriptional regulator [Oerskovia sp. Root918]|uniref:MurR/RpiR family transcriptional regulator n=1 Tax=unclassified Oerskovia TaxID=2619021 RepID=UPI0006F63103|nr:MULTISPECIES: MurR/RpiR family transcriptional regulator [unclassified Oerskovia]KRC31316.1 RpiR family transcriptional regulator [Oerskovia sp. Root22]KRD35023.1 RpiR family transcriptional regulator [Oerskovia sp. Root918]